MKIVVISILVVLLVLIIACGLIIYRFPMAIFNWQNRRALKSAGFTQVQVASAAGKQFVWEKGNGPVLILLHGAGDHAGSWSKVAPELAAHYRVIVPDLAGHGESEPLVGTLPIGTMLDGLDAVIAAKGGNERVIIAGNSLGAWLAFLYAERHPGRVERIVAIDGGPIRGERPDLVSLPTSRAEAGKLFDAILDPGTPHPAGFVLDDVVRVSHKGPIGRMVAAGVDDMSKHLLDGHLAGFTTPVDLIWGESDRLIPMTYAKRMESELPAVRLTTVRRCGHVPQQECPMTLVKTITSVLGQPAPPTKAVSVAESQPAQKEHEQ